jgi:hypothetical protein
LHPTALATHGPGLDHPQKCSGRRGKRGVCGHLDSAGRWGELRGQIRWPSLGRAAPAHGSQYLRVGGSHARRDGSAEEPPSLHVASSFRHVTRTRVQEHTPYARIRPYRNLFQSIWRGVAAPPLAYSQDRKLARLAASRFGTWVRSRRLGAVAGRVRGRPEGWAELVPYFRIQNISLLFCSSCSIIASRLSASLKVPLLPAGVSASSLCCGASPSPKTCCPAP